jgi:hypothetical protein
MANYLRGVGYEEFDRRRPQGQTPTNEIPRAGSSRTSTLTNTQLRPNLPPYMFPGTRTPGAASSQESIVANSIGGAYDDPLVPNVNGSSPLVMNEKLTRGKKRSSMKKWIFWIILLGLVVAAAVVVPLYFFVIRPKTSDKSVQNNTNSDSDTNGSTTQGSDNSTPTATGTSTAASSTPSVTPNRDDPSSLGIPSSAEGTVLDSTKWMDWTDFNVSYTDATVGGLSLMVRFFNSRANRRD